MKLPLLVSVPHAGRDVPREARPYCALNVRQIAEDGDEGAREIYDFPDAVEAFVTTDVARAIVDLNRAEDDRSRDGAIKTHTCLDVPVYRRAPPEEVVTALLERYHRPYHQRLRAHATGAVALGVDCHTMLAVGPAIGPLPGERRPRICLGNRDGEACPDDWLERLAGCLESSFGCEVARNFPFKGGYITRRHSAELPWIQIELSREAFMTDAEKRARLLEALGEFCGRTFSG